MLINSHKQAKTSKFANANEHLIWHRNSEEIFLYRIAKNFETFQKGSEVRKYFSANFFRLFTERIFMQTKTKYTEM